MSQKARFEQIVLTRSIWVTIGVGAFGVLFGLLSGSLSIVFDGVFATIDAAMSMLALFVAKLLTSEGTRRFQHGFWHIEPMVLAFNGGILMLLCFYAFLNAVGTLLEGGREHGVAGIDGVLRVTDEMGEAVLMRLGVLALGREAIRDRSTDVGWISAFHPPQEPCRT